MLERSQASSRTSTPPKPPLKTRTTAAFGLFSVVAALGGFGGWAATAPIASAVIAPGLVTVDTNRKAVQHLEGGVVKDLLVRDGSIVHAGDVLIRLDETQAKASLSILRGAHDAATAEEARLIAERDGMAAIEFPDGVRGRQDDPEVRAILSGQRNLFDARRKARIGAVEILNQRVAQLQEEISGLRAQRRSKEAQIRLIQDELRGLRGLFDKGHTTKPRMLALEREAAKLRGERGEHVADIARTRTAIGESRLRVLQLEKERREEVVTELRKAQTRIYDLAERMNAARHVLDHIEIRAPVTGAVVGLQTHTVGAVIRTGETIMEIVPWEDRLIVEAKVRPIDIDNLALGHEADVHFTAFKQRSTPAVTGRVSYLSADSLIDKQTGQAFFLVRVTVADDQTRRLGDRNLQPGMPADVIIKTGERTAAQYLAQPILDSMNRAWREE